MNRARLVLPSPLGQMVLMASRDGVASLDWSDEGATEHGDEIAWSIATEAADQLAEYFDGTRREFDVPLDLAGSDFQRRAWAVLRTIPCGSTMTYGAQAAQLGQPGAARAVGAANSRNPVAIIVPCHRVIGGSGELTGYAGGTDRKRWLLAHESGQSVLG